MGESEETKGNERAGRGEGRKRAKLWTTVKGEKGREKKMTLVLLLFFPPFLFLNVFVCFLPVTVCLCAIFIL